jgi:hypothetical protein
VAQKTTDLRNFGKKTNDKKIGEMWNSQFMLVA